MESVDCNMNKWTPWQKCTIEDVAYQYRSNGKKTLLRGMDGYITHATCGPDDTFNLFDGLQICFMRMRKHDIDCALRVAYYGEKVSELEREDLLSDIVLCV